MLHTDDRQTDAVARSVNAALGYQSGPTDFLYLCTGIYCTTWGTIIHVVYNRFAVCMLLFICR